MGLTIVHKSDLAARKRDPRIALVLAGGAVTGGAYKLGGLKALDDFLVNRKTTDFDIYVGLSAGAFLAASLASGVTPPEMLRSLEGSSEDFKRGDDDVVQTVADDEPSGIKRRIDDPHRGGQRRGLGWRRRNDDVGGRGWCPRRSGV